MKATTTEQPRPEPLAVPVAHPRLEWKQGVLDLGTNSAKPVDYPDYAKQAIRDVLLDHKNYIAERGEDHPFVLGWKWGEQNPVKVIGSSTEADNV